MVNYAEIWNPGQDSKNAFQTKMWHSNLEKFRRELIFDADKRGVSEGFG